MSIKYATQAVTSHTAVMIVAAKSPPEDTSAQVNHAPAIAPSSSQPTSAVSQSQDAQKSNAGFSQQQKAEFIDSLKLDYTGLSEVKASLEERIEMLKYMEKLSKLDLNIGLDITTVVGSEKNDESVVYARDEFQRPNKEDLEQETLAYINASQFKLYQSLTPPTSKLKIMGNAPYDSTLPKEHVQILKSDIKKIQFVNADISTTPLSTDVASQLVAIFRNEIDARIIQSVEADIEFQYPADYIELLLSDDQTEYVIDGHDIAYERISNNKIRLTYPETFGHRLIDVSALHENGRVLGQSAENDTTLPNDETLRYMNEVEKHYGRILSQLNLDKFENIQDVTDAVSKSMPTIPSEINLITTSINTYLGPVDAIRLTFKSNELNKLSITRNIQNRLIDPDNTTGLYAASSNNKEGLVNADGEWVIQPEFHSLYFNTEKFYQGDDINDHYLLDKANRKFIKLEFAPEERISNQLFVVSMLDRDNPPYTDEYQVNRLGLLDTATNELIIPTEYTNFSVYDNWIVATRRIDGEDYEGFFDSAGNEILPTQFQTLEVVDDVLFASLHGSDSAELVFDLQGRQINAKQWPAVGDFGSDNLLLTNQCRIEKYADTDYEYTICDYQFIDKQGDVVISQDQLNYRYVNPFSNGYALVESDKGLYGYINKSGKLVIPLKYKSGNRFHSKYALVQAQNGDEMLIDANDNIFKNFKDTIQQHQRGYEEYDIYLLNDGTRYSGNGELLSD